MIAVLIRGPAAVGIHLFTSNGRALVSFVGWSEQLSSSSSPSQPFVRLAKVGLDGQTSLF